MIHRTNWKELESSNGHETAVDYIAREGDRAFYTRNEMELNREQAKEWMEGHSHMRRFMVSPDPKVESNERDLHRQIQQTMDIMESRNGTMKWGYSIHDDTKTLHGHVIIATDQNQISLDKEDLAELRSRGIEMEGVARERSRDIENEMQRNFREEERQREQQRTIERERERSSSKEREQEGREFD